MRLSTRLALVGLAATTTTIGASSSETQSDDSVPIQATNLTRTAEDVKRAAAVKEMFGEAYSAYRKYAWGWDQLQPLALNGTQTRNGWGATIVDAMDTMVVMGYQEWYEEAVEWVSQVDYSRSKVVDQQVDVFETTIRYLGGMLSAYSLAPTKDEVLIEKSIQLGNTLSLAWNADNEVPFNEINTTTMTPVTSPAVDVISNIAQAGSLILEFEELSRHSGNGTYLTLAQVTEYAIMDEPHVLPGMPAQGIQPINATPVGDYATFQGGSDSYFEYLVKYALLTGNENPRYLSEWILAIDTLISKLLHKDSILHNTYPSDYAPSLGGFQYEYSHLECFLPGNVLLGGAMLKNETIKQAGLALAETCWNSYNQTATHIGPETFCYIPEGHENPVNGCNITSPAQAEFYDRAGFAITGADYILRPEVMESYFYAWRISGNPIWKERAWDAFVAIREWCKGRVAWTGILDVNTIPPPYYDDLETFFFAELMKYLYLIFSEPDVVSLDEYVFNTECHPFPIQKFVSEFTPVSLPAKNTTFTYNPGPLPAPSGLPSLLRGATGAVKGTVHEPATTQGLNLPAEHWKRGVGFH